jgi:glycosyltransferase 2 family protein
MSVVRPAAQARTVDDDRSGGRLAAVREAGTARPSEVHRHPGDLVRVGLGTVVLGLGLLVARRGELPALERDVFRLLNDLPGLVLPVVWAVMQLGSLAAVPLLAGAAALRRRFRLARDLLLAGGLAYIGAIVVKNLVGRERPAGLPVGAILHEGPLMGIGFVSGHAAVAAALATAAAPYLTRRPRRVVWGLAWTVALARVYVGAHLPLDILGGLALGWALGSAVHWLLGVPRWQPAAETVQRLLERFGLPVRDLRAAHVTARSSHPFVGTDDTGRPLFVKVLDPDSADVDRLYRLARFLAVRDTKDDDALAPLGQQVEHEAVVAMAARHRGVNAPEVLFARGTDGGAVLVQEQVTGQPLDALPVTAVDPLLLRRVWQQVRQLHGARIAHRDLVASNVLVDGEGQPWLVDFGNAESGADADRLAEDVAELLTSLSLLAEPEQVVSTAVETLGTDAVATALPFLQPLVLARETRAALRRHPDRLPVVREAVRRRLSLVPPERGLPSRPGPAARLAVLGAAFVALAVLPLSTSALPSLAPLANDGWRWWGATAALLLTARLAAATAELTAVDRRLAIGRTAAAQLAESGAGLLYGDRTGRAFGSRYLERAGLLPDAARLAHRRIAVGYRAVAGAAAASVVLAALLDGEPPELRVPSPLLQLVGLCVLAGLLSLTGQRAARRHSCAHDRVRLSKPALGTSAPTTPLGTRLEPGRLMSMVGWLALAATCEALAFSAALHSTGAGLPSLTAAAGFLVLRLLWAVLPAAGAPGLADLTLVLVVTALGVPTGAAVAGVVLFRLLAFWLPALTGTVLAARLEHRLLL